MNTAFTLLAFYATQRHLQKFLHFHVFLIESTSKTLRMTPSPRVKADLSFVQGASPKHTATQPRPQTPCVPPCASALPSSTPPA